MTQSPTQLLEPDIFAMLAKKVDALVLIVDEAFSVLFANDFFLNWTESRIEDVLGQSFLELFVPTLEQQSTAVTLAKVSGTVVACHVKRGGTRIAEIKLHAYDLGKGARGLFGIEPGKSDTLEELRQGQLRLASILETAVDGIIMIDAKGTILTFNRGAENQFGYSVDEVIGQNIAILMPSPHSEKHDNYIANYLHNNRPKIIGMGREVPGRRKDGLIFPIHLSVGREFTLGDRLCFTGVVRDLSREKRIETQLRQSQKMESIGTLAGGIAHDFNNILGGIMGYVELMLEDAEPNTYLFEDLTEMRNACSRGKDLILQILTFSRQDRTQRCPLRLHNIVKESLKLLRPVIPSNIEMQCQIDPSVDPILADATQIHQIMMNLCTNAFHALQEVNPVINVFLGNVTFDDTFQGTHPNLPYGRYVLLRISDNGTGMDESTLQRIFDPFFTTKAHGKGTGMGLAVVHGIVQNHKGDIVVESVLGKGSTFSMFFPIWEKEIEEETLHVIAKAEGLERIMLVDDDALLLKVQSRILSRRGYQVTTFPNGQDALDAFREDPQAFDLVITDQTMPKLTGMELATEIVRIREGLPIIITTGFSDIITPNKIAARGIRELLRKPVDSEELTGAVRRILDSEARVDDKS